MKKDFVRTLKKATPTILTILGSIGVVATAVLSAKGTLKLVNVSLNHDYDEPLSDEKKKEYLTDICKCYGPAVGVGAASVACIVGANVLNKRQQASLATCYAAANQMFKQYRHAANAVFGPEADTKIKAEMSKDVCVSQNGFTLYEPIWDENSDKELFYDNESGRYFNATLPAVINAEYHINRNLVLKGFVPINEFYSFLGIDPVEGGDEVGWNLEEMLESGDEWLDFENQKVRLDDGMVCYVVSAMYPAASSPD